MCSIIGQIELGDSKINHNEIIRLSSLIKHRGPDDEGYFSDEEARKSFNRLSIIDLKTGNQPINAYNVVSIFNGEI